MSCTQPGEIYAGDRRQRHRLEDSLRHLKVSMQLHLPSGVGNDAADVVDEIGPTSPRWACPAGPDLRRTNIDSSRYLPRPHADAADPRAGAGANDIRVNTREDVPARFDHESPNETVLEPMSCPGAGNSSMIKVS